MCAELWAIVVRRQKHRQVATAERRADEKKVGPKSYSLSISHSVSWDSDSFISFVVLHGA